jgi:alpha-L-rhamnosidase
MRFKSRKLPEILPFIGIFAAILLTGCAHSTDLKVDGMWVDNRIEPIGVEAVPDFRWTVVSDRNDARVSGFQVRIDDRLYDSPEQLRRLSLEPARRYVWRVRVKDSAGQFSRWSRKSHFTTGIPDPEWAEARWIGYDVLPDSMKVVPGIHGSGNSLGLRALRRPVVPVFRKTIRMEKRVKEAWLFVSGLGQYTLALDGKDITGGFLRPGWTLWSKTCLYDGFDLKNGLRRPGEHEIRITSGNGFFNINRERYRKLVDAWGNPMVRAILVIRYANGKTDRIVTGADWEAAPSPITFTSIYGGEDVDARILSDNWRPAREVSGPGGKMRWEKDYPLEIMETFKPVKITPMADSSWVYDFGQNASGIPEIFLEAAAGQTVRLTPGELVDDNGQVTQQASGGPCYYEYTSDGSPGEHWQPKFSYYGFRYISMKGGVPSGQPDPGRLPVVENIVFHHTRNSSPTVGSFRCSNELFNQIFTLIDWSVRSNLASVTTDCPHREKLGWLEETHLMGNSIRYNYDIHNLYAKMVQDMMDSQLDNGLVPDIAPEYVPFVGGFRDSPEWGSSAVIVPWYLYQWYGDTTTMRHAWLMMRKYVDYLGSTANGSIVSHGLGDWFDLGPGSPGESQLTPMALTATAIYYYDLKILSQMAGILGRTEEQKMLADSAGAVRMAFNARFYDPASHVIATGSQTAYAMPLVVGLVPEGDREAVFANLIAAVKRDGYALTAGDIGYHYLIQALQDAGAGDVIYRMNARDDVPGYGFQLKHGATALTESWPALRYVSNNHMMLGHLMEWLYTGIGGIRQDPSATGFDKIIIDPQALGDLTWADVSHRCIHGEIHCRWELSGNGYRMEVHIPVGSTARIYWKGRFLGERGSGTWHFEGV